MKYCNENGRIIPVSDVVLPIDNGAFRYGYGLFETILVENGVIRLNEFHWQRLFAGLNQLYFEIPPFMTAEWLEAEVLRTVAKNQLEKLCRVRLQMYATGEGLYNIASRPPGFIIACFPLNADTQKLNETELIAGVATGLVKSIDTLSNVKSCNALIYAIATHQAKENKWDDALVCNTNGNIIESATANIFWISKGIVYTPPLSDGCVAGVMRRHIMQRIEVKEKSLLIADLLEADEVFLSNAIKKIRWVSNIDNAKYTNTQIKTIYPYL